MSEFLSLFSRLLTTRKGGAPEVCSRPVPPRIDREQASRMRHPSYDLETYDAVAGAHRILEEL